AENMVRERKENTPGLHTAHQQLRRVIPDNISRQIRSDRRDCKYRTDGWNELEQYHRKRRVVSGGGYVNGHMRRGESRRKRSGGERLVGTRSEKTGGEFLPVHQILRGRQHTGDQEVGAALRTRHCVGRAGSLCAILRESDPNGVTC